MPDFDIRNEMMTQLPMPFRLLHLLQRSAGFNLELHSHVFYHVNIVTSGTLYVDFRDKRYTVTQGQAVILPPNVPHALSSPGGYCQIGIDIFNVKDNRGFHQLLCSTFPEGFAVVTMLNIPHTFEELFKAIRNLTALNTLKLLNAAEALLLAVLEQASQTTRYQNFKDSFLDMLSKENGLNLTLEQMCRQMSLSKTHLERLTKQEFGCGAVEYCNRLKVMKACLLLQNTDLPIKAIVENLGFFDESHFSNYFKKRIGTTPNRYRNESRKLET